MVNGHKLYFEDLEDGRRFELGSVSLSKEDIVEFADRYDPQEFHLNEEAAKAVFGGLIASGWQTACLYQRLLVEGFLGRAACLGGAGVESLRFLKPFFADANLSGRVTIVEKRLSKSRADRGLVKLQCEMTDADGDVVLSMYAVVIIAVR